MKKKVTFGRKQKGPAASRGVSLNTFNIGLNTDKQNSGAVKLRLTVLRLRIELAKVVEDEPTFICLQEVSPKWHLAAKSLFLI